MERRSSEAPGPVWDAAKLAGQPAGERRVALTAAMNGCRQHRHRFWPVARRDGRTIFEPHA